MGEIPVIGRGKPSPKPDPTKPNPIYYQMNLLQQCGEFFAGAARSFRDAGMEDDARTCFGEAAEKFKAAAQVVERWIKENESLIKKMEE